MSESAKPAVHPNPEPNEAAAQSDTKHKIAVLAVVVLPFIGLIVAIILAWGSGVDALSLGLFAAFSIATILGVTVGYHRYFTHKSFKTRDWIKFLLGVAGSASWEGDALEWVAEHRHHHKYSDTEDDHHSPHYGFFKSHVGWLFTKTDPKQYARYAPELMDDPLFMFITRNFLLWATLGLLLPAAIGWAATGTVKGAFLGFLWGGLVRVLFVHHVTWSVNSICHTFGSKNFRSDDDSRNNVVVGILALGEGWHNNHHAFQTSARHGLFWWQIDFSYILIKSLEFCGLVWDVKVPKQEDVAAKRLSSASTGKVAVAPKSMAEEAAYAAQSAGGTPDGRGDYSYGTLKRVVPTAAAFAVATTAASQASVPKKAEDPATHRNVTAQS